MVSVLMSGELDEEKQMIIRTSMPPHEEEFVLRVPALQLMKVLVDLDELPFEGEFLNSTMEDSMATVRCCWSLFLVSSLYSSFLGQGALSFVSQLQVLVIVTSVSSQGIAVNVLTLFLCVGFPHSQWCLQNVNLVVEKEEEGPRLVLNGLEQDVRERLGLGSIFEYDRGMKKPALLNRCPCCSSFPSLAVNLSVHI